MSSTGKRPSGDVAETLRTLTDGFATLARGFEPIQRVLGELSATLEPLRQTLGSLAIAAAPFVQAVARGMERWGSADRLLACGWVPHHTTPFDLVADCGNDDARLQASAPRLLHQPLGRSPRAARDAAVLSRYRRRGQGNVPGSARRPRGRVLPMRDPGVVSRVGEGVSCSAIRWTRRPNPVQRVCAEAVRRGLQSRTRRLPDCRHPGHGLVQIPDGRSQGGQAHPAMTCARTNPSTRQGWQSVSTKPMSRRRGGVQFPRAMR